MRLRETKKEKQWKKQALKNQFRSNLVEDELKEVAMMGELFEGQGRQGGQAQYGKREGASVK